MTKLLLVAACAVCCTILGGQLASFAGKESLVLVWQTEDHPADS